MCRAGRVKTLNVLILFATRQGQTAKIAARLGEHLERSGVSVRCIDASTAQGIDLDAFDLLVFGASMHAGGLERELTDFIKANADTIATRPRSFFLVLLSAATKDPLLRAESLADARQKMLDQLTVTFDDTEMIAGALRYSKYALPVKWLMRRIAEKAGEDTDTTRDYEYTDWFQVERYAQRLPNLVSSK